MHAPAAPLGPQVRRPGGRGPGLRGVGCDTTHHGPEVCPGWPVLPGKAGISRGRGGGWVTYCRPVGFQNKRQALLNVWWHYVPSTHHRVEILGNVFNSPGRRAPALGASPRARTLRLQVGPAVAACMGGTSSVFLSLSLPLTL